METFYSWLIEYFLTGCECDFDPGAMAILFYVSLPVYAIFFYGFHFLRHDDKGIISYHRKNLPPDDLTIMHILMYATVLIPVLNITLAGVASIAILIDGTTGPSCEWRCSVAAKRILSCFNLTILKRSDSKNGSAKRKNRIFRSK